MQPQRATASLQEQPARRASTRACALYNLLATVVVLAVAAEDETASPASSSSSQPGPASPSSSLALAPTRSRGDGRESLHGVQPPEPSGSGLGLQGVRATGPYRTHLEPAAQVGRHGSGGDHSPDQPRSTRRSVRNTSARGLVSLAGRTAACTTPRSAAAFGLLSVRRQRAPTPPQPACQGQPESRSGSRQRAPTPPRPRRRPRSSTAPTALQMTCDILAQPPPGPQQHHSVRGRDEFRAGLPPRLQGSRRDPVAKEIRHHAAEVVAELAASDQQLPKRAVRRGSPGRLGLRL